MNNRRKAGDIIQLTGLVVIGIGVGIELAYQADFGLITITLGSVVFALGTKIKRR